MRNASSLSYINRILPCCRLLHFLENEYSCMHSPQGARLFFLDKLIVTTRKFIQPFSTFQLVQIIHQDRAPIDRIMPECLEDYSGVHFRIEQSFAPFLLHHQTMCNQCPILNSFSRKGILKNCMKDTAHLGAHIPTLFDAFPIDLSLLLINMPPIENVLPSGTSIKAPYSVCSDI